MTTDPSPRRSANPPVGSLPLPSPLVPLQVPAAPEPCSLTGFVADRRTLGSCGRSREDAEEEWRNLESKCGRLSLSEHDSRNLNVSASLSFCFVGRSDSGG